MENSNKKNSCYVVFSPKNRNLYHNRKRFFITLNTLNSYIGQINADNLRLKLDNINTDKRTFKYRKHGIIDIYPK